jgi:hypothetical protein
MWSGTKLLWETCRLRGILVSGIQRNLFWFCLISTWVSCKSIWCCFAYHPKTCVYIKKNACTHIMKWYFPIILCSVPVSFPVFRSFLVPPPPFCTVCGFYSIFPFVSWNISRYFSVSGILPSYPPVQ